MRNLLMPLFGTALLLAVPFAAPASAQQSESEFTDWMIERVRAAAPSAEFEISPDNPLEVRMTGHREDEVKTLNLTRIFNFCSSSGQAECEAESAKFVAVLTAYAPPSGIESLRVIVRDDEYWASVIEFFKDVDYLPFHRRIGSDLYAILAFDRPDRIEVVGMPAIEDLGLVEEHAWQIAAAQTRAILPELPDRAALQNRYVIYEGEGYLASLLFDTGAWEPIAERYGPQLFAAPVSDKFVAIGLMQEGVGLATLRESIAQDCAEIRRCVSPHIYRFRAGRWMATEDSPVTLSER